MSSSHKKTLKSVLKSNARSYATVKPPDPATVANTITFNQEIVDATNVAPGGPAAMSSLPLDQLNNLNGKQLYLEFAGNTANDLPPAAGDPSAGGGLQTGGFNDQRPLARTWALDLGTIANLTSGIDPAKYRVVWTVALESGFIRRNTDLAPSSTMFPSNPNRSDLAKIGEMVYLCSPEMVQSSSGTARYFMRFAPGVESFDGVDATAFANFDTLPTQIHFQFPVQLDSEIPSNRTMYNSNSPRINGTRDLSTGLPMTAPYYECQFVTSFSFRFVITAQITINTLPVYGRVMGSYPTSLEEDADPKVSRAKAMAGRGGGGGKSGGGKGGGGGGGGCCCCDEGGGGGGGGRTTGSFPASGGGGGGRGGGVGATSSANPVMAEFRSQLSAQELQTFNQIQSSLLTVGRMAAPGATEKAMNALNIAGNALGQAAMTATMIYGFSQGTSAAVESVRAESQAIRAQLAEATAAEGSAIRARALSGMTIQEESIINSQATSARIASAEAAQASTLGARARDVMGRGLTYNPLARPRSSAITNRPTQATARSNALRQTRSVSIAEAEAGDEALGFAPTRLQQMQQMAGEWADKVKNFTLAVGRRGLSGKNPIVKVPGLKPALGGRGGGRTSTRVIQGGRGGGSSRDARPTATPNYQAGVVDAEPEEPPFQLIPHDYIVRDALLSDVNRHAILRGLPIAEAESQMMNVAIPREQGIGIMSNVHEAMVDDIEAIYREFETDLPRPPSLNETEGLIPFPGDVRGAVGMRGIASGDAMDLIDDLPVVPSDTVLPSPSDMRTATLLPSAEDESATASTVPLGSGSRSNPPLFDDAEGIDTRRIPPFAEGQEDVMPPMPPSVGGVRGAFLNLFGRGRPRALANPDLDRLLNAPDHPVTPFVDPIEEQYRGGRFLLGNTPRTIEEVADRGRYYLPPPTLPSPTEVVGSLGGGTRVTAPTAPQSSVAIAGGESRITSAMEQMAEEVDIAPFRTSPIRAPQLPPLTSLETEMAKAYRGSGGRFPEPEVYRETLRRAVTIEQLPPTVPGATPAQPRISMTTQYLKNPSYMSRSNNPYVQAWLQRAAEIERQILPAGAL